jgi:hypothetical protein
VGGRHLVFRALRLSSEIDPSPLHLGFGSVRGGIVVAFESTTASACGAGEKPDMQVGHRKKRYL